MQRRRVFWVKERGGVGDGLFKRWEKNRTSKQKKPSKQIEETKKAKQTTRGNKERKQREETKRGNIERKQREET